MSSPYLDKYFKNTPETSPYQGQTPYLDPAEAGYDSTETWEDWEGEGEFSTTGNFEDPTALDAFGAESFPEEDWTGESLGSNNLEGGAEVELTDKQKRLLERIQKKQAKVQEEFQNSEKEFHDLESGNLKVEDRDAKLAEISEELENLLKDLNKIEKDKKKLCQTGAEAEVLLTGVESSPDGEEFFGDETLPEMGDDIKTDIEELAKEVEAEETLVDNQLKAEETKEKIDALEEKDKQHGDDVKYGFLHAKEFITGGNGIQYGTAKVWGKKHIRDFREGPSTAAELIFQSMADAAGSGEWDGVISQVESISAGEVDNALGLVHVVLKNHHPELLKEIPSNVLEKFHKNIMERGNDPQGSSIVKVSSAKEKFGFADFLHVVASGGWSAFSVQDKNGDKKWKLHDNRRRDSLEKIGTSYAEAASGFLAQAESNKSNEEVKNGELEALQNQLESLNNATDGYADELSDDVDEGEDIPSEAETSEDEVEDSDAVAS